MLHAHAQSPRAQRTVEQHRERTKELNGNRLQLESPPAAVVHVPSVRVPSALPALLGVFDVLLPDVPQIITATKKKHKNRSGSAPALLPLLGVSNAPPFLDAAPQRVSWLAATDEQLGHEEVKTPKAQNTKFGEVVKSWS